VLERGESTDLGELPSGPVVGPVEPPTNHGWVMRPVGVARGQVIGGKAEHLVHRKLAQDPVWVLVPQIEKELVVRDVDRHVLQYCSKIAI